MAWIPEGGHTCSGCTHRLYCNSLEKKRELNQITKKGLNMLLFPELLFTASFSLHIRMDGIDGPMVSSADPHGEFIINGRK